jgi:glycosyltransferase involved in cell wall biosynthesis
MIGLAEALVQRGHEVSYTVTGLNPKLRRSQTGWPESADTRCNIVALSSFAAAKDFVQVAGRGAVHLFQGIRGRPVLEHALEAVITLGAQPWCLMERIDERHIGWPLKRLWYSRKLQMLSKAGVRYLAIGQGTAEWLVQRGASQEKVFPFAYFLPPIAEQERRAENKRAHIAYVGQLIRRKRVDLLMRAAKLLQRSDYDLTVVGDGPEMARCRRLIGNSLPLPQQHWVGVEPMAKVRRMMETFDVLVLPSAHDGWGAVVSEALLVGTPVICSDRCGAAAAVYRPEMGRIFRHGDVNDLRTNLAAVIVAGPVKPEQRARVRRLANVLTTMSGAAYLESLLDATAGGGATPRAPWLSA